MEIVHFVTELNDYDKIPALKEPYSDPAPGPGRVPRRGTTRRIYRRRASSR